MTIQSDIQKAFGKTGAQYIIATPSDDPYSLYHGGKTEYHTQETNFLQGLNHGNLCIFVDGTSAYELGAGSSYSNDVMNVHYQYDYFKSGGSGTVTAPHILDASPMYDIKTFQPSQWIEKYKIVSTEQTLNYSTKEVTTNVQVEVLADRFRFLTGRSWLIYKKIIRIPHEFTGPPNDSYGWEGLDKDELEINHLRWNKYDTPIFGWNIFITKYSLAIGEEGWQLLNPGFFGSGNDPDGPGAWNWPTTHLLGSEKSTKVARSLRRRTLIHSVYRTTIGPGEESNWWTAVQLDDDGTMNANYFISQAEFLQKNPVINSWATWQLMHGWMGYTNFDIEEPSPKVYPSDVYSEDGESIIHSAGSATLAWAAWYAAKVAAEEKGMLHSPITALYDYYFRMRNPFDHKYLKKSHLNNVLYAKMTPKYNYTVPKYEGIIADPNVSEPILPNMYVFMMESKISKMTKLPVNCHFDIPPKVTAIPSQFLQIITLDNLLPNATIDILNDKGQKIGESLNRNIQYFKLWTNKFQQIAKDNPATIEALTHKQENIVFCPSDLDILNEGDKKLDMFPMAIEVEFTPDRNTEFSDMLRKTNISRSLLSAIVTRTTTEFNQPGFSNFRAHPFVHANTVQPTLVNTELGLGWKSTGPKGYNWKDYKTDISLNAQRLGVLDVDKWIAESAFAGSVGGSKHPMQEPYTVFIGMDSEDKFFENMPDYEKLLKTTQFLNYYKKFVTSKFREDFSATLNGEDECYNETLFYRIEKKVGTKIIQNIYLPNSGEINIMRYYDTQVKYGVQYTYTIYAYQLVVGTRYRYRQFKTSVISMDTFTTYSTPTGPAVNPKQIWAGDTFADYEPSVQIIEVPWYERKQAMVDHPPAPPNVEFIPYRGVKNEILINMTQNSGEYLMQPISISTTDTMQHWLMQDALHLSDGEPMLYKGDDPVIAYEVFRTTERPKKWSDFSQKIIRVIDTIEEGSSLKDKLMPNTKYYYIVRAIDRHFHFSNPSAIYEVELMADSLEGKGGLNQVSGLTAVKPKIRVVELDNKVEKSLFKPMRKYLKISPALEQVMLPPIPKTTADSGGTIPTSAYNMLNKPLGITPDPLFGGKTANGRKFKIRLTSRKTGKKMDVNVDFKTHFEKIYPEKLEEHASIYDMSFTEAQAVMDNYQGNVAGVIMQVGIAVTSQFQEALNTSMYSSIVDNYGMGATKNVLQQGSVAAAIGSGKVSKLHSGAGGSGMY